MTDELPITNDPDPKPTLGEQMRARIAQLNFAEEFDAAGECYSELDEDGQVVTRNLPAKP